jgi:hypothetical protein
MMGRPRIYGEDRTESMTFSLKKDIVDSLQKMKTEGVNVSRFVNNILEEKLDAQVQGASDTTVQ